MTPVFSFGALELVCVPRNGCTGLLVCFPVGFDVLAVLSFSQLVVLGGLSGQALLAQELCG